MQCLSFGVRVTSLRMIVCSFIHLPLNFIISFFNSRVVFVNKDGPRPELDSSPNGLSTITLTLAFKNLLFLASVSVVEVNLFPSAVDCNKTLLD